MDQWRIKCYLIEWTVWRSLRNLSQVVMPVHFAKHQSWLAKSLLCPQQFHSRKLSLTMEKARVLARKEDHPPWSSTLFHTFASHSRSTAVHSVLHPSIAPDQHSCCAALRDLPVHASIEAEVRQRCCASRASIPGQQQNARLRLPSASPDGPLQLQRGK